MSRSSRLTTELMGQPLIAIPHRPFSLRHYSAPSVSVAEVHFSS